jgi:hypothetical protein
VLALVMRLSAGEGNKHAAQQGAAPDRLQLRSFRSSFLLTPFSSLPAAGELVVGRRRLQKSHVKVIMNKIFEVKDAYIDPVSLL